MKNHKWRMKEQAAFLRKTGELLERGYPLAEAIRSLTYQMKSRQKEDIAQALLHLREGHPFHQILHKLGFNQTLVGYVYFAEEHGSLADAFREGSTMILKRQDDVEKLKKLLVYPTILIAVTLFLFSLWKKYCSPNISCCSASMNLKPNIFMRMVSFIGESFSILRHPSFTMFAPLT